MDEEIKIAIDKVYKYKDYPNKADFVIKEPVIHNIKDAIIRSINTNAEIFICNDCNYSYWIFITSNKNIPVFPPYKQFDINRKLWLKKYGNKYWQMNIVISKIAPFAVVYWVRYNYKLFLDFSARIENPPGKEWSEILGIVKNILASSNIRVIPYEMALSRLKIKFGGKISDDINPSIVKLLFTEEIH